MSDFDRITPPIKGTSVYYWHICRRQVRLMAQSIFKATPGVSAPARGHHPKDKARVERQMPYMRDNLWRSDADNLLSWMARTAPASSLGKPGQGPQEHVHGATGRQLVHEAQGVDDPLGGTTPLAAVFDDL